MVTSRVPAIIDYLVTTFTNASTLGAASPPVTVFDGPQTTDAPYPLVLWVGLDDPDTDQVAPSAAAAFGIVAAVEDIVRSDPFSGLALFPDPGVTGLELRQNNTQAGSQARVSFQIAFKSRL